MKWFNENKTKLSGALILLIGFLQTTDNAQLLTRFLGPDGYSIFNMIMGAVVLVLGFWNTNAIKQEAKIEAIAEVRRTGGFASPLLLGWIAAGVLLVLTLVGCGVLQELKPETFNQRVQAGYAGVTYVARSATTLRQAGKLTDRQRDNIADQAQNVKDGIDIADTLKGVDPDNAEAQLAATEAALKALRALLVARGETHP